MLKNKKFRNVTYEGFHSNRTGQLLQFFPLYTIFDNLYHFTWFIGGCKLYTDKLSQERLDHRKPLDSSPLSHSVTMATGKCLFWKKLLFFVKNKSSEYTFFNTRIVLLI